jgi:hypothetical protein
VAPDIHGVVLGPASQVSNSGKATIDGGGDTEEAIYATEWKRFTHGYDFMNHWSNASLVTLFFP